MTEAQKLQKATYHLHTFLVSKMVGALGSTVYQFGISLYILSITGSALNFAANMLASILPRIIVAPFAGTIADRVPRKVLVIGGQIGEIIVLTSLLTYTLNFGLSVEAIYITTAFYTIFSTFSGIAFSASIANLVDEERIQKAMSFNQLSTASAGILGPIIGGMLFGFVTMPIFLMINIVSLAITTILEATMNFTLYKKEQMQNSTDSMWSGMKEGLRYVKGNVLIQRIMLAIVWINLFFTAFSVGSSFILIELLEMKSRHIGFIEAGGAIGMIAASLYFANASKIKNPIQFSRNSILAMSLLIGLFSLPLFVPLAYPIIFIYYFMLLFTLSALTICTNMPIGLIFQTRVEELYRGRVYGLVETAAMALMPIGTLIYGILFDQFPAEIVLIVSSVILLIVTPLTLNKRVIVAELADRPVVESSNTTKKIA